MWWSACSRISVSRDSDKLMIRKSIPDNALINSNRLLILLEAGSVILSLIELEGGQIRTFCGLRIAKIILLKSLWKGMKDLPQFYNNKWPLIKHLKFIGFREAGIHYKLHTCPRLLIVMLNQPQWQSPTRLKEFT